MKHTISTRVIVRLVSFGSALVLVCAGVMLQSHAQAKQYQIQLEVMHTRALGELSSYLTNIATDLQKGRYVGTSTRLGEMSARIWRESAGAKSALENLPVGRLQLEGTYKFLSQAGDYAMALAHKLNSGGELTEEERKNAQKMGEYAANLRDYVDAVNRQVEIGQLSLAQMQQTEPTRDAAAGFSDVEQVMSGYPTLIYDGPFSDHLLFREPLATKGQASVTANQARSAAALAARINETELKRSDDENSHMPSYTFYAGDTYVGVSKAGGYVTYLLNARTPGKERVNQAAVFERANAFLKDMGLEQMRATYFEKANGICTINYAAVQDNVILYPDLVKVGVALDDGGIVFYDARGYLVNHHARELPKPTLTAEQAAQSLSPMLAVTSNKIALIPTESGGETLTYEFSAVATDNPQQKLLVYINATTGAEENILLLIETPNGTLTK